jgi:hypothetical protein
MLGQLFKRVTGKTDASSRSTYPSDIRTFGRGTSSKKFQKIDESIAMNTISATTECRVDATSDSGSETALSPSAKADPSGEGHGKAAKGITVQRTLQVSISKAE